MSPEPDYIFWLKRWRYARTMGYQHDAFQLTAAINQMAYLTEIFSWIMEKKEKANGKSRI